MNLELLRKLMEFDEMLSDSHSSSSDDDDEIEAILRSIIKVPRVSIIDYYEEVVQAYTDDEFVRHFRIKRRLFLSLSKEYEQTEEYQKMLKQNPSRVVSAEKTIAIFLWFAANEHYVYRNLSDRFNISMSTVHEVIRRGIAFISNLAPKAIKWPSNTEMYAEAMQREAQSRIPGIMGCIDGTHIRIDPPKDKKDDYIDRKGDITLTVQAVCNKEKKFIDCFIGYPGSVHDSRVFRNSPLNEKLKHLPADYHLVGDSAYPCISKLLTPYRDNGHLTAAQRRFNIALSSQQIDIEHSFGILKQRFRSLYYCRLCGIKPLCHFIRACIVLHNLSDVTDLEFSYDEVVEQDDQRGPELQSGNAIRNEICENIFGNE